MRGCYTKINGPDPFNWSAVVSALHDVQWDAIKLDAGAAGHRWMLHQK
jgi:hypothetical protein